MPSQLAKWLIKQKMLIFQASGELAMTSEKVVEKVEKGLFEGMIEALSGKHSQLDIKINGLTLSLGRVPLNVELNGTISLSVHMRNLTDEERQAYVQHNISSLKH